MLGRGGGVWAKLDMIQSGLAILGFGDFILVGYIQSKDISSSIVVEIYIYPV